jgi:hypothetical protein
MTTLEVLKRVRAEIADKSKWTNETIAIGPDAMPVIYGTDLAKISLWAALVKVVRGAQNSSDLFYAAADALRPIVHCGGNSMQALTYLAFHWTHGNQLRALDSAIASLEPKPKKFRVVWSSENDIEAMDEAEARKKAQDIAEGGIKITLTEIK